jgi:hypothetical protein
MYISPFCAHFVNECMYLYRYRYVCTYIGIGMYVPMYFCAMIDGRVFFC